MENTKRKELTHIKVGELEIPASYWEMTEGEKNDLCLTILDSMLIVLDYNLNKEINRFNMLDNLLQSSIIINELTENYEVTDVMTRIRQLINE
jgi:hypothetical protein